MSSTPLRATAYRGAPFLSTSTVTVVCPSGERTAAGCAVAVTATNRVANQSEAVRAADFIGGPLCHSRGRQGPRPPVRPPFVASPEATGSLAMIRVPPPGQRSMQTYSRPCGAGYRGDSLRVTFRRPCNAQADAQIDAQKMAGSAGSRAGHDDRGGGRPHRTGRARLLVGRHEGRQPAVAGARRPRGRAGAAAELPGRDDHRRGTRREPQLPVREPAARAGDPARFVSHRLPRRAAPGWRVASTCCTRASRAPPIA